MKFIHTADLHLDSPFNNLIGGQMPTELWDLIYKSTYRSFQRIVDAAIKQRVDFVLIVGDLFDRQTRSVKAQNFLKRCLEKLDRYQIPVYLSFGNHDYYNGDYHALRYPRNTHVFPAKVTTQFLDLKNGRRVGITGFSYRRRWESQRMIDQFQPKRDDVDYQIGMIHGQVSSGNSNYTPFKVNELRAKHYDYWALGHVHKRQALCNRPPAWYCGNIQGRNPNESGEKGYLLVDSQNHFQPQFKATSVINWQTLRMKITTHMTESRLIVKIMTFLADQHFSKFHLVKLDLRFQSRNLLSVALLTWLRNGNVLDQVQGKLAIKYQQLKVWVYRLRIQVLHSSSWMVNLDHAYWRNSGQDVFSLVNEDRLAKKLFRYSFLNRHFNNPQAIKRLKQQARQLIQDHGMGHYDN